jgi:UDP-N-acetylmuramoyl-L-alanyl-D-glutamate--2,6-diaminopimelate ligase
MSMNGSKLKEIFPEFSYSGNINAEFDSIEIDSRRVKKGSLFVAIKGTRFDSHKKIPEAISKGAKVIVAENDVSLPKGILLIRVEDSRDAYSKISSAFFGFPSRDLKVVGITGTSGKTTTAYALYAFFNKIGEKSAFLGTIGEDTGNGFVFKEKFPPTTPDAFYMNRSFYEMKKNNVRYVFMEVSSSSILFKRISGVSFYKKILTNIDFDHLDVHKTFSNYLNCKLCFFKGESPSILNADSRFIEKFLSIAEKFETYGIKNPADYRAKIKDMDFNGIYFDFIHGKKVIPMFLKVRGEFNVYNFLAVVSFALEENIEFKNLKDFAEQFPEIPGRMNVLNTKRGIIIIDFAHNPYEIEAVLRYANQLKKGRLIVVTGAVGWSTKEKRYKIGIVASSLSDLFILTTDDPRGDDPDSIMNDVMKGVSGDVLQIKDRFLAIKRAVNMMQDGDVVAILGRGEEKEIHFKDKTVSKSDIECVEEILGEN